MINQEIINGYTATGGGSLHSVIIPEGTGGNCCAGKAGE